MPRSEASDYWWIRRPAAEGCGGCEAGPVRTGPHRQVPGTRRGSAPFGAEPRPVYSAGLSESMPERAFFHSPRVKSGICCGTPLALMERWLSGTGAVQVAAS